MDSRLTSLLFVPRISSTVTKTSSSTCPPGNLFSTKWSTIFWLWTVLSLSTASTFTSKSPSWPIPTNGFKRGEQLTKILLGFRLQWTPFFHIRLEKATEGLINQLHIFLDLDSTSQMTFFLKKNLRFLNVYVVAGKKKHQVIINADDFHEIWRKKNVRIYS